MGDANPWDIVGWSVVVALCCLGLFSGTAMFLGIFWRWALWLRTHDLPPTPGQVWNQHGARLYVIGVDNSGWVTLRSYGLKEKTEWRESPASWKERVELRHLYLMPKETERFKAKLAKEFAT